MRMRFVNTPDPGRPINAEPRSPFVLVFDQFDVTEVTDEAVEVLKAFGEQSGAKATLCYSGTIEVD